MWNQCPMFFPYPCLVSSSIEQKLHQKYVRLPSSSVPVFRQKGFLFHLETLARKLDFLIIHCNTLLGLIYLLFSLFVINAIIIFSLLQEILVINNTSGSGLQSEIQADLDIKKKRLMLRSHKGKNALFITL